MLERREAYQDSQASLVRAILRRTREEAATTDAMLGGPETRHARVWAGCNVIALDIVPDYGREF